MLICSQYKLRLILVLILFCPLLIFSQNEKIISSFLSSNCEYDNSIYYSYTENLSPSESKGYDLDVTEQIRLKESLIKTLVSFIKTKSTQSFVSSVNNKKFSEKGVFNSFAETKSNALLFNPSFALCKDDVPSSKLINKVIVYVEKKSFDELAINYFLSTIKRTRNNLNSFKARFKIYSNDDFSNELKILNNGLDILSSYYGLVVSLGMEEKGLEDFFDLESDIEDFSNTLNSLENNLVNVNTLVDNSRFSEAYKIMSILKSKYDLTPEFKKVIDRYNESVKVEKKTVQKQFKKESISFNDLSIEIGANSALISQNNSNDGVQSSNSSSMLDRLYPFVGGRLIFNDREKKFGIGPYGRYHFSENLIVLNDTEYFFPFSKSYLEAGVWGQYFFIRNFKGDGIGSFTLSVGKLMNSFISENDEELNFINISPGFKTYLQGNDSKSYRTSLSIKFNITTANTEYSYSSVSIGYSRHIKFARKISDKDKKTLEDEYKIFR